MLCLSRNPAFLLSLSFLLWRKITTNNKNKTFRGHHCLLCPKTSTFWFFQVLCPHTDISSKTGSELWKRKEAFEYEGSDVTQLEFIQEPKLKHLCKWSHNHRTIQEPLHCKLDFLPSVWLTRYVHNHSSNGLPGVAGRLEESMFLCVSRFLTFRQMYGQSETRHTSLMQ